MQALAEVSRGFGLGAAHRPKATWLVGMMHEVEHDAASADLAARGLTDVALACALRTARLCISGMLHSRDRAHARMHFPVCAPPCDVGAPVCAVWAAIRHMETRVCRVTGCTGCRFDGLVLARAGPGAPWAVAADPVAAMAPPRDRM